MRRFLGLLFLVSAFTALGYGPSQAKDVRIPSVSEVPMGQFPGDKGYRHSEFHPSYQKVFDQGRCACSTGECRPTIYRPTRLGSQVGLDVLVNRRWVPVPKSALVSKGAVPPALWRAEAHVCAYEEDDGTIDVECFIMTAGI